MQQGKLTIEMGICPDCGNSWSMTDAEYSWWKYKVEKEGSRWPLRCLLCRKSRRTVREENAVCSKILMKLIAQFDTGELDVGQLFPKLEELLIEVEKLEKKVNKTHGKAKQTSGS